MEFKGRQIAVNILTWLLLSVPRFLYCQRITCPTPCDVGFTCAMVRNGNSAPSPGCISMEEAILLHQALNGGPTGPGTGLNVPARQQSSTMQVQQFPQQMGMNPIPGMNFLGNTAPEPRGFEQRFQQGMSRAPTGSFQGQGGFGTQGMMPGQGQFTGAGFQGPQIGFGGSGTQGMMPGQGQFTGTGFQGPQTGFGGSGFMDPTGGQFIGAPGTGIPGQGFGFGQGVDGGHSHSSHATLTDRPNNSNPLSRPGSLGHTNSQSHDPISGGGGRTPSQRNDGFPGEGFSQDISAPSHINTETVNDTTSVQEIFSTNQTLTPRPERQGQVSRIMEDSMGLYYLFFPRENHAGIRVNITKLGFCKRDVRMRERNMCMNTCYSDQQCPRDYKCCPSGCSLGCMEPTGSNNVSTNAQSTASFQTTQSEAIESRCIPCQSHLDCNSQDQFCTMSDFCGQQMVCRQLVR